MNPLTPSEARRLMRTMTPSQRVAMTSDNFDGVMVGTLRGLQRRGFALFVDRTFWAFTPYGRRLRAAMFAYYDSLEREHQRAVGGAT